MRLRDPHDIRGTTQKVWYVAQSFIPLFYSLFISFYVRFLVSYLFLWAINLPLPYWRTPTQLACTICNWTLCPYLRSILGVLGNVYRSKSDSHTAVYFTPISTLLNGKWSTKLSSSTSTSINVTRVTLRTRSFGVFEQTRVHEGILLSWDYSKFKCTAFTLRIKVC